MGLKKIIGISDCDKYQNYYDWIVAYSPEIEVVKLSYQYGNSNDIEKCTHLLLTGGEDVHPRFYNQQEMIGFCFGMNEKRDEFELELLEQAKQRSIHTLGICRGLQIANVFYGGTLIPDLPTFGKYNHSKHEEGKDRYHSLHVDTNSMLHSIVQSHLGNINSAHHQSAGMIGKGLVANCFSPDGVIEGIEKKDARDFAWFLLVQWHPERMTDKDRNTFSTNIRKSFLEA